MNEYFIEIVETSTGKLVGKTFAGYSIQSAERALNGIVMNMEDDRYHAEVVTYGYRAATQSEAGDE